LALAELEISIQVVALLEARDQIQFLRLLLQPVAVVAVVLATQIRP
jgi:hypothetical protein